MPPAAPTANRRTRKATTPALRFDQRLVLNQWMLGLFEVDSFIPLTDCLYETTLKGVDADNNLENLKRADETWKVRRTEDDFKRLMFDVQDM
jgi:hypothetical protein